jgi:ElaB/YqjD/DUF883 family membrane-anchored ribosome-binding protein
MTTEIGKNIHEAEREIAAQREFYAAFLQLINELLSSVPGFKPGINVQKNEGFTIERKPKGELLDDVLEVKRELAPDATRVAGNKILYGIGQNNLTDNDIKAIAAIIAGKKGDTVIGGESLIIKYNGKVLFETDELGKVSLHAKVSPEIREKFAALKAGKVSPTLPKPSNAVIPSQLEEKRAFATLPGVWQGGGDGTGFKLKQSPLDQEVTTPDTSPSETVDSPKLEPVKDDLTAVTYSLSTPETHEPTPPRTVTLPPILPKLRNAAIPPLDNPETHEAISQDTIQAVSSPPAVPNPSNTASPTLSTPVAYEATPQVPVVTPPSVAPSPLEDVIGDIFVNLVENLPAIGLPTPSQGEQVEEPANLSQKAEPTIDTEARNGLQQVIDRANQDIQQVTNAANQVASKLTSISEAATNQYSEARDGLQQVINRANQDIQQVTNTVNQVTSRFTAISDRVTAISEAATDQYMAVKTMLVSKIVPQENPRLDEYINNLGEAFDEIQQDDPTFSANNTISEIPLEPVVDQKDIFSRQREKLDATRPFEEQEAILKTAFKIYFRNLPKEQEAVMNSAGNTEVPLPTGANLLHELTAEGAESLSIEKDGEKILLGGRIGGHYTPADTLSKAVPELRELRPFLSQELKLSPEPINAFQINQPLPMTQREAAEPTKSQEPPKVEIHLGISPDIELTPTQKETVKVPAQSKGGR